jgi:hypothetical protein
MGARLLAGIGFIVSPGMIFTMAGKVDYMSLQPEWPTPTVSSECEVGG